MGRLRRLGLLVALLVLFSACATLSTMRDGSGVVRRAQKAPIVPDGDVAARPTDVVIDLDVSLDPAVAGRTLLKGRSIKVTFPEAFTRTGTPLVPRYIPGKTNCPLECAAVALLQGWPQQPLPFPKYEARFEGTHTVVITAKEDLGSNPPQNPGLKQVHLLASSFRNPPAGRYPVKVVMETGRGGDVETGWATVKILPAVQPSINVTSAVFQAQPPRRNPIYQEVAPGREAPIPFDFLLWDAAGKPMVGVRLLAPDPARHPKYRGGLLVQGDAVVGGIVPSAPPNATGQRAFADAPSKEIKSPVSGIPVGLLRVRFQAGNAAGEYAPTFELINGNQVQMFVRVK